MSDIITQRALSTWYKKDHPLHRDLRPAAMGLAGEAGELVDAVANLLTIPYCAVMLSVKTGNLTDLVKKIYYKPGFERDDDRIIEELGDVLFYLSILAHQIGVSLDDLSLCNHRKLNFRELNGVGYNRGVDSEQD